MDVKSKQKSKVISEIKIKRRRVNFSLEATEAKEIILIGDFNNWNPKNNQTCLNCFGTQNSVLDLT